MKRFLTVSFLAVMLSVGVCFIAGEVLAQDKVISIRFANQFAPGASTTLIAEEWCKEVAKRTNGKVKVQQFPGNTLTTAQAIYDSVTTGIVDMGNAVLGYTAGKFPLSEVLDYPLGYPNSVVASKLMNEYYKKFKPKEFDEVKILYFHAPGPGLVHTKTKPVNKLEDMKGLKMRTFGSNAKLMALMGGAPVAMPMPDAYDAISRGVADGYMGTLESLKNWKLAEVIKYTTESYGAGYTSSFAMIMNKKKWDSIPPDLQKIIEGVNQDWIVENGKAWDAMDKEGREFSLKRGNKIISLSPEENARWAKAAEPLFDDYVKRMKAKNLPGEEVLKFARDYLKAAAKK